MKPTQRDRGQDQLGRSGSAFPIRLLALTLFAVIVGSAWPISARSLDPACDTTALACHAGGRLPARGGTSGARQLR